MAISITYLIEHESYSQNYYSLTVIRNGLFHFRLKIHETIIYNLIKFFYNMKKFNMEIITINLPIAHLMVFKNNISNAYNATYPKKLHTDFVFTYFPLHFIVKNNYIINYYIKQFESLKHGNRITLQLDFNLKIYDKCIDDRIKEYNNL